MNYIRHLNAFFTRVRCDEQLGPHHVSLYMALFQYWNFNRFHSPFPVYRENIMQLSRIGSKNTYHKCLRSLHESGYIIYHAAPSKYLPVRISMVRLDVKTPPKDYRQLNLFGEAAGDACPKSGTQHVPHLTDAGPTNGTYTVPNMGHYIKQVNNKHIERKTPTREKKGNIKGGERETNEPPQVSKMGHVPGLQEVEAFFAGESASRLEASRFFHHYHAVGWKLGTAPIQDWQAAARKWLINTKEFEKKGKSGKGSINLQVDPEKDFSAPL